MVQAAAQAQAVVAAAKNRGGGLVPMNAAQIAALSQIQAQAIVNARPQTALLGGGTGQPGEKPTPQQIQNQVQLQAQALVHAHTQAQIAAGIYKGGDPAAKAKASTPSAPAATAAKAASATDVPPLTPAQIQQQTQLQNKHVSQQNEMANRHATERTNLQHLFQHETDPPTIATQSARMKDLSNRHGAEMASLKRKAASEMAELHAAFRKQNAASQFTGTLVPKHVSQTIPRPMPTIPPAVAPSGVQPGYPMSAMVPAPATAGEHDGLGGVVMSATSPEFLAKLNDSLTSFWSDQLQQMRVLGSSVPQTEQDFKTHNDLPLARIKRIMKSDEDVRMISAEAPVLFAKACEMFILELTLRSWHYSENNKRKTLQKEDIREAIQRTDIFDFLVDVIH